MMLLRFDGLAGFHDAGMMVCAFMKDRDFPQFIRSIRGFGLPSIDGNFIGGFANEFIQCGPSEAAKP